MERSKTNFDILGKITEERIKRQWSEYTLAKNSDLTQSTISSWYRKGLEPSVYSIEKICNGMGISLSQFFGNDDMTAFSEDEKTIHDLWIRLSPEQKKAVLFLLQSFIEAD